MNSGVCGGVWLIRFTIKDIRIASLWSLTLQERYLKLKVVHFSKFNSLWNRIRGLVSLLSHSLDSAHHYDSLQIKCHYLLDLIQCYPNTVILHLQISISFNSYPWGPFRGQINKQTTLLFYLQIINLHRLNSWLTSQFPKQSQRRCNFFLVYLVRNISNLIIVHNKFYLNNRSVNIAVVITIRAKNYMQFKIWLCPRNNFFC